LGKSNQIALEMGIAIAGKHDMTVPTPSWANHEGSALQTHPAEELSAEHLENWAALHQEMDPAAGTLVQVVCPQGKLAIDLGRLLILAYLLPLGRLLSPSLLPGEIATPTQAQTRSPGYLDERPVSKVRACLPCLAAEASDQGPLQ
jgi:hypothetical protein